MPDFSVHLTNYLFFISAKMCDNDEAGCSKRISAEGELRPPNKQLTFWEAAQRLEDDEEYHPSESEDDEMDPADRPRQPGNHPYVLPAYLGGVNSELECGWSSRAVPDSKHGQQPLEQRGADESGELRVRDSAR